MGLNNELEGYSHPMYTELHEALISKVAVAATATSYGHFRSRNKVIVRAVSFALRSNCSSTAGTLNILNNTTTIATIVVCHASTGGGAYVLTKTLVSSNTLATITDTMTFTATGGINIGKWDVLWEYDVVYPATKIGS
jgi:hypothetical protein